MCTGWTLLLIVCPTCGGPLVWHVHGVRIPMVLMVSSFNHGARAHEHMLRFWGQFWIGVVGWVWVLLAPGDSTIVIVGTCCHLLPILQWSALWRLESPFPPDSACGFLVVPTCISFRCLLWHPCMPGTLHCLIGASLAPVWQSSFCWELSGMLVRILLLFGSSLVQQIRSLRWGGWQPWFTRFRFLMYMGRLLFGSCVFPPIGLRFAQRRAWWFWLAWMVMSCPNFQCVFSFPPPSCPGFVDSLTVFLAFVLWGVPWLFPQSLACACEWVQPKVLAMLHSFHFSQSMVSRTWH